MCTADALRTAGGTFTGPTAALRTADAALDYLNSSVATVDGAACGDLLIMLGERQRLGHALAPGTSPSPSRSPSPAGPASCPRTCAWRPTGSCCRRPRPAPASTTWP